MNEIDIICHGQLLITFYYVSTWYSSVLASCPIALTGKLSIIIILKAITAMIITRKELYAY